MDEVATFGESVAGGAEKSRRLASAFAALAEELGHAFADAGLLARPDPADGVHLTADSHASPGRAVASAVLAVS